MLEQESFTKFIDLISFDKKIRVLEKEAQVLSKEVLLADAEKQTLLNALSSIDNHVHDLKKEVDAKELEMKSFEIQEKELRAHLEQVKHTDEYQALKRETDALKKKQHDYEESLLDVWAVYENAQKEVSQKKIQLNTRLTEISAQQQEHSNKKIDLEQQILDIIAQRKIMEAGIPELWIEQYMRKRMVVDDPVIPIVSGSCSACFYNLSLQDNIFLKKNRFLQCKECYRLLYLENK
ncbi:hypothetical protein EBU24_02165 [bacterium]|nr:hypothetical protein [bacterium]